MTEIIGYSTKVGDRLYVSGTFDGLMSQLNDDGWTTTFIPSIDED